VGVAKLSLEAIGVLGNEIQNAPVLAPARGAMLRTLARVVVTEQALKYQARVHFRGQGRGFGLPGEVILISATVAGVAIPRGAGLVPAQLQRGQGGAAANPFRGDLVHGNAGLDVGARGLARLAAGE